MKGINSKEFSAVERLGDVIDSLNDAADELTNIIEEE